MKSFWFYHSDGEKTKLNWFLYEYACKLYEDIKYSHIKALSKWKSQRSDVQIAEFSAYFAKRMRQSVDNQLAGLSTGTEIDEEYIRDYCHTNTRRENEAMIEIASDSWVGLLDTCVTCPCRCVSERYRRSEFFDRM